MGARFYGVPDTATQGCLLSCCPPATLLPVGTWVEGIAPYEGRMGQIVQISKYHTKTQRRKIDGVYQTVAAPGSQTIVSYLVWRCVTPLSLADIESGSYRDMPRVDAFAPAWHQVLPRSFDEAFPYFWHISKYPISDWPEDGKPAPDNRMGQRCRLVRKEGKNVLSRGGRWPHDGMDWTDPDQTPEGAWWAGMGAALVEFVDGHQTITLRRGLRRWKPTPEKEEA